LVRREDTLKERGWGVNILEDTALYSTVYIRKYFVGRLISKLLCFLSAAASKRLQFSIAAAGANC
jgi:hypothetical protein